MAAYASFKSLAKTLTNQQAALVQVRAAVELHACLLQALLRLPSSFFDVNPSGRVLNRFSRDTEVLDGELPLTVAALATSIAYYLTTLVVIAIAVPWFLLALPLITAAYAVLQRVYIPGARELQRLQAVSCSAIYTGFSECVAGAATIRAFAAAPHFVAKQDGLVHDNGRVMVAMAASHAWLGLRLAMLGASTAGIAAMLAVGTGVAPAAAGLALTYALELTLWLQVRCNCIHCHACLDLVFQLYFRCVSRHRIWPFVHTQQALHTDS